MSNRRSFLIQLAAGFTAGYLPESPLFARDRVRIPSVDEIRSRSPEMWRLVDLINEYRVRHGLHAVPLSPRMTAVAAMHAKDLAEQRPHEAYGSLHSWSHGSKRWNGGGYDHGDKATWPVMWTKPKEIAEYPGLGFEICAAKLRDMEQAVRLWQQSPSHNNVMLNREVWRDRRWQWQAMGAVFHRGYACAWFGDRADA